MKLFAGLLGYFVQGQGTRRNLHLFFKFLFVLAALVICYSIIFHFLMAMEGRTYSWITGVYWTLTVMTTLGFGDITFHSDLGRLFSTCVLISGVIFLLTLLPFIFIQFFYAPWMEAESKNRAPSALSSKTKDHVILTDYDPVTIALIEKLKTYGREYVLIVEDLRKALELYDIGIRVALGHIDDLETYRKMQIDSAALVVATSRDEVNTNVAFTVRELNDQVPIITTADSSYSVDILQMAGSTNVLQLHDILGRSLAMWTVGGACGSNVIRQFDELVLAAFPALSTPLVGKTLMESRLRENFGITVAGIWEQGQFRIPDASAKIGQNTVLLLAGSKEKLAAFDEVYSYYQICELTTNPVLIIGGGRVGQTIADQFKMREMSYLIIEKNPRKMQEAEKNYIAGNAADIRTLQRAWVKKAPAALITTHDDATNIYLTKYLRSLRHDMQILSRASVERNVSTLHRAGADFVMSYSSLGANAIFSFLKNEKTLILGEGLNVFRVKAPRALVGKNLAQSKVREKTQCSIIAVKTDDVMAINPDPQMSIGENSELILIGTYEGEKKFLQWTKTA